MKVGVVGLLLQGGAVLLWVLLLNLTSCSQSPQPQPVGYSPYRATPKPTMASEDVRLRRIQQEIRQLQETISPKGE
jgi:hypothetical protein